MPTYAYVDVTISNLMYYIGSTNKPKESNVKTKLFNDGLLRIKSIIGPDGPIPVSKSTWYAGVNSGRFPKPVKLGPRTTAWRAEDIRSLIEQGVDDGNV